MFYVTPDFPASSQHRAPDSLAIDIRALYTCILRFITLPVTDDQLQTADLLQERVVVSGGLTYLSDCFTADDMS